MEASLRRLQTDHLGLLWVPAWDYTTPVEEVMRALDDLVAAGKVDAVALSDAPAWVASAANTLAGLRGWSPLVALQAEYSLLEGTAERELLPVAHRRRGRRPRGRGPPASRRRRVLRGTSPTPVWWPGDLADPTRECCACKYPWRR